MKKIIIVTAFVCSTAICSNIFGQQAAPPGAGDKDLRDNNVKTRSVDLERVDRDARKSGSDGTSTTAPKEKETEDQLAARFGEIKTDFEQVQLSQDAVIKAYQSSSKIDYAQIGKSASEINKSAMRLNKNLFTAIAAETPDAQKGNKQEEKKETETKPSKTVRDLIVELDNSIGKFAASPMFQNLRLIDPRVSIKARMELNNIIELSAMLGAESQKMANPGQ